MERLARSKSYSQVSGVGGGPATPTTTITAAASSSSSATNAQSVVKNILKSVESHVRIMSHSDRISISSSSTALRLRLPEAGEDGSSPTATPVPSQYSQRDNTGGDASPLSSQGGVPGWSPPFTATRIHRAGSTARFYDDVIAPCVSNCTSGQSYLFLVNGPPESGRSQTLYGSPHHSEVGLVELTAADLLRRMSSSGRVIMRGHRDLQNKENDNGGSEVGDNGNGGGGGGATPATTGGITVTYSAFTTRGSKIMETETGESVPLVEFPPPLGLLPLPTMRLLEEAGKAVLLPERKHVDTSCVIQFQVYAAVDSSGRRSMATLTFVDVAAIREPLCREVAHLIETVERVAGVTGDGGDASFKETKLTTVLEPALVGYVTLVSITTISGREDLYESTCAALRLANTISRIHQVLMLTHINAPRWLFDTAAGLEQLRKQREQLMTDHYARGVHDYYQCVSRWLMKNANDLEGNIEHLLNETASVRKDIAAEMDSQSKKLGEQIEKENTSCRGEMESARLAYEATSRQFDEMKRLDESIAAVEQKISQTDMQSGHRISEMRIEISALEAKANSCHQQLQQLEKEMKLYVLKTGEVGATLEKYGEDLRNKQLTYSIMQQLLDLGQKRQRYETDLELASQAAHRQTDTLRVDRERRSRLSRLVMMENRVYSLRERLSCSTANQSGNPFSNSAGASVGTTHDMEESPVSNTAPQKLSRPDRRR